ncbi:MAG TPA: CHASE2 domain-containing protein [Allocoleopsis sp.]
MTTFQLQVRQFERQTCVFELSWGKGQRLCATLAYPKSAIACYDDWKKVYLCYYKSTLRGREVASGTIALPQLDWHAKLVQAEAKLLSEFHHWLRSAELFEIRAVMAKGDFSLCDRETQIPHHEQAKQTADVFLTCHSIELERLPWEAWEIGAEFPAFGVIRITRTPVNIRQPSGSESQSSRGKKARILVILGDETGLNFQGDKKAVHKLSRLAEIEFVGWQPGQDIPELKAKISAAIASERGWDVLLFAGHSNEMAITGGELAIAPNTSISIREITPQLLAAKQRGLKFALFNSCCGLDLATSLIDLGLSQVAVMREPVHNTVAQVFLQRFMQELAEHKDVHDSLLAACHSLKVEKNLTYPSAYLVPSLFCHPDAVLYGIPRHGLKERLKRILPSPAEAIAIGTLTLLSLSPAVQDWLLEQRVYTQAVYRQLTGQLSASTPPPVLLVQIDEESIQKAGIADPKPMNRTYLASLVDRLVEGNAPVIGIDYPLARPQKKSEEPGKLPPDMALKQSLEAAVKHTPSTKLVFAAARDDSGKWLNVSPEIASPNWSLIGHVKFVSWYMSLVPLSDAPSQKLPFSYLLALAHQLPVNPQLTSQTDYFAQASQYLKETKRDRNTLFSPASQLQPITGFSYRWRQMWLHPIVDFSIPPQQVYESIPAWQLLENHDASKLPALQQQIAIIAPGGYGDAGIFQGEPDNFPLPTAVRYWFERSTPPVRRHSITGGEVHAYMIHHFLNRRLVVPIPDLWLIGVAAVLGRLTVEFWANHSLRKHQLWFMLIGVTSIYGLVGLQVYISAAILLPWVFPIVTVWAYFLLGLLRGKFQQSKWFV